MQLMLILGIVFAIGAVVFALQNDALVVVTLALWRFEGSLAVVLLVALGLGVVITALLTTPAVIRGQWTAKRLRRQVTDLERQVAAPRSREPAPAADTPRAVATDSALQKPYVGLRTLLAGEDGEKPPQ